MVRLLGWVMWRRVVDAQMKPISSFFFFNDTATTEIYTLSLHDALPISPEEALRWRMGFMSAYWDSGSSKQCKPLRLEGPYGNWSGDISALRLHEIQSQNWGTVVSQEGSPYPEPGPISCATPRELTDQFYITRYLVEEECEAGFLPANRVPDDVRVCSKKGLDRKSVV